MTAWRDIDPSIRDVFERLCSPKELDAVKLTLDGAGRRTVGRALGISDSAARDRLRNARRKTEPELGPILDDLFGKEPR